MRRRSEIFIGDLVRAVSDLDASPATAVTIAELLRLAEAPPRESVEAVEPTAERVESPADAREEYAVELPPAEPEAVVVQSELIRSPARPRLPEWFDQRKSLDRPAAAPEPEPELEPLFLPLWTPGILFAAVSARDDEGPIDIERVVRRLAQARPLDELPRLPWPTLRRGAQILVDAGSGLDPFRHDQTQLVVRLRGTVGTDRVEVLRFIACPTRGAGAGPVRTWRAYEPPRAGKPVVLLTDLGVGLAPLATDRADVDEWLSFAAGVRAASCPLVAFVPYPLRRVPPALRRALAVVPWDRPTSIGVVRRLVGPVLEPTR